MVVGSSVGTNLLSSPMHVRKMTFERNPLVVSERIRFSGGKYVYAIDTQDLRSHNWTVNFYQEAIPILLPIDFNAIDLA